MAEDPRLIAPGFVNIFLVKASDGFILIEPCVRSTPETSAGSRQRFGILNAAARPTALLAEEF